MPRRAFLVLAHAALAAARAAPIQPSWQKQLNDALPHVQVRLAPTTAIKLRKNIRWLSTLLSFGADYSTQQGLWTMKYSWEDTLVGGRLALKGSELELNKAFVLNLGTPQSLAATLRLRAAIDVFTGKMSARLGFRAEPTAAEARGVDLVRRLTLDADGHAKIEVKVRLAFPSPEIVTNREGSDGDPELANSVYVGMGDLEVDVDELNLLFDW